MKKLQGSGKPTAMCLVTAVMAVAFLSLVVIFALIWIRHPALAALGVVCVVALGGSVVVLVADRSKALSTANALREKTVTLAASLDVQDAELRKSHSRIIAAGLEERQKISRDLHDGLQGYLMAVNTALASAISKATDTAAAQRIEKARGLVRQSIDELRFLTLAIYPNNLDLLGLEAAVDTLVMRLDIDTDISFNAIDIPSNVELESYYLISEVMTNAVKHAQASHIDVDISVSDGVLNVKVSDNGIGGADPNGHGLTGLKQRVSSLGGELSISSPAGHGTTIYARIPCA